LNVRRAKREPAIIQESGPAVLDWRSDRYAQRGLTCRPALDCALVAPAGQSVRLP